MCQVLISVFFQGVEHCLGQKAALTAASAGERPLRRPHLPLRRVRREHPDLHARGRDGGQHVHAPGDDELRSQECVFAVKEAQIAFGQVPATLWTGEQTCQCSLSSKSTASMPTICKSTILIVVC